MDVYHRQFVTLKPGIAMDPGTTPKVPPGGDPNTPPGVDPNNPGGGNGNPGDGGNNQNPGGGTGTPTQGPTQGPPGDGSSTSVPTPSQPPPTSSPPPPPTSTSVPSSSPPPPPTSNPEPTTIPPPATSEPPPPPPPPPPPSSTTVVVAPPPPTSTETSVTTITTISSSPPTSSASAKPTPIPSHDNGGSDGLSQKAKVAIGVVVPIAAIAILAIIGLFWWKKRRARRQEEEERRKEVEEYGYNPNAGPTIPAVGMMSENGRDDGSGYRGWGTTVAGSTGHKASTTMSGGFANGTFSDGTANSRTGGMGPGDPYADGQSSPDGEILGAMGPSAAHNRSDVKRGPSNASSSYSAGNRSEGSDGGMYGGGAATFYDQYAQNPYDNGQAPGGQAIIRDNPARRNTQIENSSHYAQQSAGIAQNF